jgi:hypothetical protein
MSDHSIVSPSGSGQPWVSTGGNLVTQIARCVGGESEEEVRGQALDCLNRARIELNQHDWRFMKRTDDPITLVDGTATYSLEATFHKPSYAYLIDSSALLVRTLENIDDAALYRRRDQPQPPSGIPIFYSLRNEFEDGLVTLYPTPDAGTASQNRLVVEYFARIGAFSDDNEAMQELPEEVTNVLVIGGQSYLLRERRGGSPEAAQSFADYQRTKMLLLTEDRRVADEQARFQPRVRHFQSVGVMYLKI